MDHNLERLTENGIDLAGAGQMLNSLHNELFYVCGVGLKGTAYELGSKIEISKAACP